MLLLSVKLSGSVRSCVQEWSRHASHLDDTVRFRSLSALSVSLIQMHGHISQQRFRLYDHPAHSV